MKAICFVNTRNKNITLDRSFAAHPHITYGMIVHLMEV